jgi:neutral ceramidase
MIMYRELSKLNKEIMSNPYINLELQILKFGDAIIAGIPGELFSDFGLELKRRSPFEFNFIAGMANGCFGYIPTKEAFLKGGELSYETQTASYSKLSPEAGDIIVRNCIELINKMRDSKTFKQY